MEFINNHNVTCDECLYHITHVDWVDEMPFRVSVTCKLNHETDYYVPYVEYWDCEYFEKWTFFKALKLKLRNVLNKQ